MGDFIIRFIVEVGDKCNDQPGTENALNGAFCQIFGEVFDGNADLFCWFQLTVEEVCNLMDLRAYFYALAGAVWHWINANLEAIEVDAWLVCVLKVAAVCLIK